MQKKTWICGKDLVFRDFYSWPPIPDNVSGFLSISGEYLKFSSIPYDLDGKAI